ncbi:hypothetical protein N7533_009460 [Penicillium manginii]|uniref:uncharacterized protein n=1 Tax=Penicillium manginii TaxID=203109 RepID=UPI00254731C9|nr:uncharacterized protein N7533_009460 [Penicillium manginii]KAJ5744590.1 hypothetical protein N7533_009460 [Penicillium manginii]
MRTNTTGTNWAGKTLILALSSLLAPNFTKAPSELSYVSTPSLSSSNALAISASVNSTLCGSLIRESHNVVKATEAYDCLRTVPFHAGVARELIHYLNETIQFQSTLAYLASPPPEYQQPAVDLVAGLASIARRIDGGNFTSEYDFETTLQRLLNDAHDDHLTLEGGILSSFIYGAPYDIVSLSLDGVELPKLYLASESAGIPIIYDTIFMDWGTDAEIFHFTDELRTAKPKELSEMPSPIATINGEDAVSYITRFAAVNSLGKLEPHADWNMLMRSGALDSQGLMEVFFGGTTTYPGDTITIGFEDGHQLGPEKWLALYLGPPNTGPLQTAGDFYNFFTLGLSPASYNDTADPASTTSASATSDSSPTATSSSKPWWDEAYPTPEALPASNSDEQGLPRIFFLNKSSVAVLSIPEFTMSYDLPDLFISTVKAFLRHSKSAGLKKIVIDVQQNHGGSPLLAIEVFKLFFPRNDVFAGSRRRMHPMADVLGYTLTNYWNNLTRDEEAYLRYFPNEWVISTRMNPDTEADYTSWDEYSESPYSYNKDHFTNVERYDLANTTFTEEAAAIEIDNVHGSQAAPYAAADIIILSDGLCSSACALFMELMRHEANVKTVVVGGRPDYTPMQAPSGTRGAASYDIERMDYDITAALSIGDSVAEQFPTEREHAFFIAGASVNLRDQILRNDNSKTPLQFKFERADCRIFYTPDTWYNFTNLWNYAAKAAWKNSTLCIEKSPDHPTQPSASSTIYEVEATESTFVTSDLLDDKGEFSASIHLDDPSNDISDSGKDIENLKDLGKRCKGNHNCGGRLQCISVPVWDSELKPTMQRQCTRLKATVRLGLGLDSVFPRSSRGAPTAKIRIQGLVFKT